MDRSSYFDMRRLVVPVDANGTTFAGQFELNRGDVVTGFVVSLEAQEDSEPTFSAVSFRAVAENNMQDASSLGTGGVIPVSSVELIPLTVLPATTVSEVVSAFNVGTGVTTARKGFTAYYHELPAHVRCDASTRFILFEVDSNVIHVVGSVRLLVEVASSQGSF